MLNPIFLLMIGFVLLGVGAEVLVGGSSRLAVRLGIAPLIIGLTIVAFGTSAPELAVSIRASTSGSSSLALGNVIGSNIANIGLILGITAMIAPIRIEANLVKKEIPIMIGSSFFMALLVLDGVISFTDGLLLTGALLIFLVLSYRQAGHELKIIERSLDGSVIKRETRQSSVNLLLIIGGLAMLIIGSEIFVSNAVLLAQNIGISEAVIGLSIVAIGTSIPELATSLVAALRKESDIAIGNIIGSNLFNILCILGVTALISTIYAEDIALIDIGIMLLFACSLLPFALSNLTLSRLEGFILVVCYLIYLTYILYQG